MSEKTKTYTNGEVTIVWKPGMCIHSENCWRNLPGVFNPKSRPWIDAEGASSSEIIAQINKCPSGALTYLMNDPSETNMSQAEGPIKVEALKNGPLIVHSSCRITNSDGSEMLKEKQVAFCRCGASSKKPYCDGTHRKIDFEG